MTIYNETANIEAVGFLNQRSIIQKLKDGINFEHVMVMNETSKCKAKAGGTADVMTQKIDCESDSL